MQPSLVFLQTLIPLLKGEEAEFHFGGQHVIGAVHPGALGSMWRNGDSPAAIQPVASPRLVVRP